MTKPRKTALQLDILELWADGVSRNEIAKRLGCSLSTVSAAKKDPELRQMFYERQSAEIEKLVPVALKRLKTLINDDKQQGAVHIAAVREILDRSHIKELCEVKQDINITISYE